MDRSGELVLSAPPDVGEERLREFVLEKRFWIYTYDQHTHVFPEVGIPYNPANFYTLPAAAVPSGESSATNRPPMMAVGTPLSRLERE